MTSDLPDPDWYLDNVVVPSGPDRAHVGPARRRRAEWDAAERQLVSGPLELARAVRLARRQGFVLTHEQARGCGVPNARIRSLVRRGVWSTPRRGVLSIFPAAAEHSTSIEVGAAAVALVRPGAVVSHASAAAMHGLPLLDPPSRPTLTATELDRTCGRADARIHTAALHPDEVTAWFGVPVTTIARTVVDLARGSGCAAGLVVADAALHESLVTPALLRSALGRCGRWPGVTAARRAVVLASPQSESPLESLTRLCLDDGGVPRAHLQAWVSAGRWRYRVDMLWPRERVVLEADGALKYSGSSALWAEKLRQERLERAGYLVVRVNWQEVVYRGDETVARVLAALTTRR